MTSEKSILKNLMIAFMIIALASFIINGIVSIRDALINSGLLSGTIQSSSVKTVSVNDVKNDLLRKGVINSTDQKVFIKDVGDKYIVTVMKKKATVMLLENKSRLVNDQWVVDDTMIYPKQQVVTQDVNYDFTNVVKLLASIIGIFLLIIVAEKLGIKL